MSRTSGSVGAPGNNPWGDPARNLSPEPQPARSFNPEPTATAFAAPVETHAVAVGSGLNDVCRPTRPETRQISARLSPPPRQHECRPLLDRWMGMG